MEMRRARARSMKRIEKSDTENLQSGQRTVALGSQNHSPSLMWELLCCGNSWLSLSSNSFFALDILSYKGHSSISKGWMFSLLQWLPTELLFGSAPQASFPDQLNSSAADCFNHEWKVITPPLIYKGTILYWKRESRRHGVSLWNELTHDYHAPRYSLLGV